jgi:hypothetical protein
MQIITSEKQALLNLGKINGWIESSRKTSVIRESVAKLSFALPQQDATAENIEDILSSDASNETLTRYIDVFMSKGPRNGDLVEELKCIHSRIFSQKDGYSFHPGEWKNNHSENDLRKAFEDANSSNSVFEETIDILGKFHDIAPFKAGNELIERILPSIYLQRLGIIDIPFLSFHNIGPGSQDIDTWFKDKTDIVINILHKVRNLQKEYAQRTVGLSKQRSSLFEDLLPFMMRRPKFTIKELQEDYKKVRKITFQTFSQLIKDLEKANVLIETTGNSRFRVFHLHEYTNLYKKLI